MKQYRNGMKATEFSKKQIGVVYRLAKIGDLKVEKWVMSEFYDLADYYGYDDNRNVEWDETWIQKILECVFSNNIEEAQERINNYTKDSFSRLGYRAQKSADRNLVA